MDVRDWKQVKRHRLSAGYADLEGRAWTLYVANLKKNGIVDDRKIVMYEGQVIDGWQLLRACIEADVKPDFKELRLPKGMTVDEWVETVNDHRRHETQEKAMARADARRERVASARAEGESLRTIAENEGVSEKTIRNDLEALGAEGSTPEPPDGIVTGKDGKEYPAEKPAAPDPPRCTRCQRAARVGQEIPKNCPDCKTLREPKPEPSSPEPSSTSGRQTSSPKNGAPVFDDAEVLNMIGKLTRSFDARAKVLWQGAEASGVHRRDG